MVAISCMSKIGFLQKKKRRERGRERNSSTFISALINTTVVSRLSVLKGVLLGRIMEGNTNRMFKEDTSLSDHLNEFQGIIDQMSGMCIKFEDEILGLLLLNSLLPNGVISLQMIKGSVLNEEMRRKAQGSSSQPEENKGKKGKSKEKDDNRATTATGDFGVLKMGNDGVTKVISVGSVCFQTNTGMQLWLRGVKHAPDVRFNMIYVHMLDDGGYDNHFVVLNTEVPDNIWFDKDVKYDHLRVFCYKAFVHVLKDERSKLDMKTRQCIFIGYGHNEYGYRMYDPVEKELVKSHDVQFMEDQTIENINKIKKFTLEKDNSLFEIDLVRMSIHDLDIVDNNVKNGEQHNYGDQQLRDGFANDLDFNVEYPVHLFFKPMT
ncbi:hypothetical protein CR513_22221, partial [Mucuna pruriens]